MIHAAIFDLDGTLVQTEVLKAQSYGLAVHELTGGAVSVEDGATGFYGVFGKPRRDVAMHILRKFGLEPAAAELMAGHGVSTPWQAFVQVRLGHYKRLLDDPATLRGAICPNNMALFREARARLPKVAVATSSRCDAARAVLGILGIGGELEFLATADDVEHGKPDPEIYLLTARELGVEPAACLAVEDSASGVESAVAAGMTCLAAVSEYTAAQVRGLGPLERAVIVEDPALLVPAFQDLLLADGE